MAALHRSFAEVIGQYDGFVANFPGEDLLAYFGYPAAHEDDAERAVRAGLTLVDAIGRFEASNRPSVVGAVLSLATRLQALAEPNTILITESTRRQIGAFFELEDAAAQPPGGGSQRTWRVLGERRGLGRFEALRSEDTPLVGREEEIALLGRLWSHAKAGDGHAVLLSGEPGVGKSRLAGAVEERLGEEPHHRLRFFCSSYHQSSALYPVIA
jgi:hypothetical protein